MIEDWLFQTSIDVTLLIVLVLALRPVVRKTLGANVAYWLWLLPFVRAILPDLPERNGVVLEAMGLPTESLIKQMVDVPELSTYFIIPWQSLWLTGICLWFALRLVTTFRFRRALFERAKVYKWPPYLISALQNKTNQSFDDVQFFSCTNANAPLVTGLLRPCIFLPQDFDQRFNREEQVWVLIHELTHIHRKDLWVQFVMESMRGLFWFNPLVHLAAYFMQADQELACDYSVLNKRNGQDRYQYGKALMAGATSARHPTVMRFFTQSKVRISMLSKHKVSNIRTFSGAVLCVLLSAVALTKAPTSIAQNSLIKNEAVSLEFKEIPLIKVVQIIANFSEIPLINPDFIDETVVISIRQQNVSAQKVLKRALQCGSYDYVEYEIGLELIRSTTPSAAGSVNCVVNLDGSVVIDSEEFAAN